MQPKNAKLHTYPTEDNLPNSSSKNEIFGEIPIDHLVNS